MIFNGNKFGGYVQLEALAYDMGLSIRQAQVYGNSVLRSGTDTYGAGYGANFDLSQPGGKTSYLIYADTVNVNGLYDAGEALGQNGQILGGYYINRLCATLNATENCSLARLDLFFGRVEPDAFISVEDESCTIKPQDGPCYESARVELESPRGDLMNVVIYANGQISVRRIP